MSDRPVADPARSFGKQTKLGWLLQRSQSRDQSGGLVQHRPGIGVILTIQSPEIQNGLCAFEYARCGITRDDLWIGNPLLAYVFRSQQRYTMAVGQNQPTWSRLGQECHHAGLCLSRRCGFQAKSRRLQNRLPLCGSEQGMFRS
jgi:hypothetical protein